MALDDDDDDDDVYVENNCRIPGQSKAIPLKQWLGGYVAAWPLSCAPCSHISLIYSCGQKDSCNPI